MNILHYYPPLDYKVILSITQEAMVSNLPDTVLTIFQEAIDSANKGIVNWVFKYRGMKLLSVLSLPYTLPVDVVYATFTKFLVSVPYMGSMFWNFSRFFMDQLSLLLNKVNTKRQQLSAKISCQLAITEYGGDNFNAELCQDIQLENRNKINLNFMLNIDDDDLPINKSPKRKFATNKILSRRTSSSNKLHDLPTGDDTFDNILQVTTHHEAIMAYYYLDENNKVKVTEIFDVTDSDSPAVQTPREKEINQQLQFDDDWDDSAWVTQSDDQALHLENRSISLAEISEYSLEDMLDRDNTNIFSDPESEWAGTFKVEEPEDNEAMYRDSDLRPEADQPSICEMMYKKPYHIPSFTFQDYSS